MWVVFGLGNPGKKYLRTRHNIGFMVVEEVAKKYHVDLKKKEKYRIGKGFIDGHEVILIEPLLYMNRSGSVVKEILDKFNIPLERILVIYDDLDMDTGRLRIRNKGSSGGHKGIESIIDSISSKDFLRLKIGIGRDRDIKPEDYVLRKFKRDEVSVIKRAMEKASEALVSILTEGVERAMNRFNTN
ncbi:MAG: aminoacyl-tRNA hydrolase [Nitrospirae bacterium]|nr:aminoacyl-tRNA hydrolase [Nitrospirota bacterium]